MPSFIRPFSQIALCTLALFCGNGNAASESEKPYLLLISIDGFRWDYLDKYPSPAMNSLAKSGIRADALIPVFPTLTFPNHYSIATGLFPAHHGIVSNEFPDPELGAWYINKMKESAQDGRWYGGEPIWVAAAKAGMQTAAFFFIGSEAEIQGIRPERWNAYQKSIPGDERVSQVLEWLGEPEATRPQVITLYFEDVDDHTHWSGVGSAESIEAIARVDGYIQRLVDGIDALPFGDHVTIILVSDHGQLTNEHPSPPFILEGRFNLTGINPVDNGSFLSLHFEKDDPLRVAALQNEINLAWDHGTAYRSEDAPAAWQIDDNPRFPDLILMPEPGFGVLSSLKKIGKIKPGGHGWAPETPEMRGIFVAVGPGIPAGLRIPPISVVDVFPLMLRQLGLPLTQQLDSDLELWPQWLETTKDESP